MKDLIKATTSADSTGELAESIKPTEARMNGYGCFAAVRPVGTDSKACVMLKRWDTKNMAPANSWQSLKKKAVKKSEKECLEIMQKAFEEVTK